MMNSRFKIQDSRFKMLIFVLCVFHFLLLTSAAHAHLPMETEYAETLPNEGWEVSLHSGYMDMSKGEHNSMTEQMYELRVGYGLTRDISVYVEPTYKIKDMETTDGMEVMKEKGSGIGDTDLLARYRFLKKDKEDGTCQGSLLLGVKLPTGAWNIEDNGERLMDMVQPGTGSTDYRGGLAFTGRKGNFTMDGDIIYRINTENQKDYKFGNLFSYDVAGLYQINDLYMILELNGRLAQKDEIDGEKDSDTGGHQIFITPGSSYHIMPNLMLMLSVQVPVYTDMNGDALKTNYHAMGGVHWYF